MLIPGESCVADPESLLSNLIDWFFAMYRVRLKFFGSKVGG